MLILPWYVSVVSTFPNTFALVLDSNLHDLNETNPDWRCFQQNYHGVIYVQKQNFSEWPETSQNNISEIIKNPCKRWRPGSHTLAMRVGARLPPRARPLPHGPPGAPPTSTPTLYIHFWGEKNQGEGFIAFYELPPSPKTSREGWSGVRSGLRRGESIAIVIINHPPSPISWCSPPCVSNFIVGLLDRDGLDEIYHVIELFLLGFDP